MWPIIKCILLLRIHVHFKPAPQTHPDLLERKGSSATRVHRNKTLSISSYPTVLYTSINTRETSQDIAAMVLTCWSCFMLATVIGSACPHRDNVTWVYFVILEAWRLRCSSYYYFALLKQNASSRLNHSQSFIELCQGEHLHERLRDNVRKLWVLTRVNKCSSNNIINSNRNIDTLMISSHCCD